MKQKIDMTTDSKRTTSPELAVLHDSPFTYEEDASLPGKVPDSSGILRPRCSEVNNNNSNNGIISNNNDNSMHCNNNDNGGSSNWVRPSSISAIRMLLHRKSESMIALEENANPTFGHRDAGGSGVRIERNMPRNPKQRKTEKQTKKRVEKRALIDETSPPPLLRSREASAPLGFPYARLKERRTYGWENRLKHERAGERANDADRYQRKPIRSCLIGPVWPGGACRVDDELALPPRAPCLLVALWPITQAPVRPLLSS